MRNMNIYTRHQCAISDMQRKRDLNVWSGWIHRDNTGERTYAERVRSVLKSRYSYY